MEKLRSFVSDALYNVFIQLLTAGILAIIVLIYRRVSVKYRDCWAAMLSRSARITGALAAEIRTANRSLIERLFSERTIGASAKVAISMVVLLFAFAQPRIGRDLVITDESGRMLTDEQGHPLVTEAVSTGRLRVSKMIAYSVVVDCSSSYAPTASCPVRP